MTFPIDAHDPETLLALADANLRLAKREHGADRSERAAHGHGRVASPEPYGR